MSDPKTPSRRRALGGLGLTGLGLAGLAGAGAVLGRQADRGSGGHDAYFQRVARALAEAGIAQPTLVIDRSRLEANIAAVKANLAGSGLPVRVVVKSLPAIDLIDTVARGLGTDRFMVFNGEMLHEMQTRRPGADLLMGKPLPVVQTAAFYDREGPVAGPQWLVDTPERLHQIAAVARQKGVKARISFEIDVGLHRGGFVDANALAAAVELARQDPHLEIAGLMGYDPHVPKTLNPETAFAAVLKTYAAAKQVLADRLGGDPARLTLNTAGSPTYLLHAKDTVANEVSIGSAFVKPADFDLKTLTRHQPAAYIATPVIKALDRMAIPSLEGLSGVTSFLDPNTEKAFFVYGGHWNARPVSPPGLQYNDLFGRSSNQELLTGSRRVKLAVDDLVFLRPNQSEALFFQFGDLAIYDAGRIVAHWPTFPVSA